MVATVVWRNSLLKSELANRPPVSVVLPFRDAAGTLDECLDSVLAQSLGDFECLAIDDGSSDEGARLVLARADRRLRLVPNPRPGLVSALNLGLGLARGPLVARMDADDRMHPQRLEKQLRHLLDHPRLTVLGSQVRKFPEGQVAAGYREYLRWQNQCLSEAQVKNEIYVESPFAHPSVMFRRASVLDAGGYRDGMFPEDYELWLRLHAGGHPMAKLPEVLLDWRESPGRLSRSSPRYTRAAFDALRAEYLARDARLRGRELVVWGAGRRTRKRVGHLLERGVQPRAWVDVDPAKIGNRIEGLPVHAPEILEQGPRPFVLVYVASHGARDEIGAHLATMGYRPGEDFLAVG